MLTDGDNIKERFYRLVLQIVIVIKSRSTPCTLEKRFEANSSEARLPNTFVDGTDRPGADETVSLKFTRNEKENYETVEIYMKYIASKLVVRRIGKYLAFSARLPEEVIRSSSTYEDSETGGRRLELCTAGCPADELVSNLASATRRFKVDREQALSECKKTENSDSDLGNHLTGSYLDWCVFDLMSAGLSYDFIQAAHIAQADALSMEPYLMLNGTEERSLWRTSNGSVSVPSTGAGAHVARANPRVVIFQLVVVLYMTTLSVTSLISRLVPLRQPC